MTNKLDDHLNGLVSPDDLSEFKDTIFCDVLGNGWADYFYNDKPVTVYKAPTIIECLKLLASKRVSGIIHAQPVLELYIKNLGLNDKLFVHTTPSERSPVFPLLISKKVKLAKEILTSFDRHFEDDHKLIHLDHPNRLEHN